MSNHASITLLGRAGSDPVKSDRADVAQFNLAVTTGYGDKAVTTWYRISVWGKSSEYVLNYVRKGSLVHVLGEPSVREYTDKEGQKRQSLEVRALSVSSIKGSDDAPQSRPEPRSAPQPQRPTQRQPVVPQPSDDDLLPF